MQRVKILSSGAELICNALKESSFNFPVEVIVPPTNLMYRLLRLLFARKKFIGRRSFFKSFLNLNNEPEHIIIFDSILWDTNIDLIREMFPKSKITYFFLNVVEKKHNIKNVKHYSDQVFTFDRRDSMKYGLSYHHFFSVVQSPDCCAIRDIDVLFVGKNKGRLRKLEEISSKLLKLDISAVFYVVKDSVLDSSRLLDLHNRNLLVQDYNILLRRSKCLLEICQDAQMDCTIRVVDAFLGHQKVITNNLHIKSYDFYNPKNILVLENGTTDEELKMFINTKYQILEKAVYDKYRIENWLSDLVKE